MNGPNLFISTNAGNTSLTGFYNIGLGSLVLWNLTFGVANTIIGYAAEPNINSGQNNVDIEYNSLAFCTAGTSNNVNGVNSLPKFSTELIYNIIIGTSSGNNCLGAKSNNIIIGNTYTGTTGESKQLGLVVLELILQLLHGKASSDGVLVYVNNNQILGTITSLRRFKENIIDAKNYDILKFRVVNFHYIDDSNNIQVGLIAEEDAEIYPELIAYDENDMP